MRLAIKRRLSRAAEAARAGDIDRAYGHVDAASESTQNRTEARYIQGWKDALDAVRGGR